MIENNPCFILIHSPLVGPLTWQLVAAEIARLGLPVFAPTLIDDPRSSLPYCEQQAASLAYNLSHIPPERSLILVAHSGTGPLLPLIRRALPHPVTAYAFVDAGIPRHNASRLDLMRLKNRSRADQFHQTLLQGARFPMWREADLQEIIPDPTLRRQLIAELNPRPLSFFTEPVPVFPAWPDAPCLYIKFTAMYDWDFQQAVNANWTAHEMDGGHFHMLVDPAGVADLIVKTVTDFRS